MPAIFINETGTAGIIFQAFTNNITGSIFLTLVLITIIIMAFFASFGLPLELSAIFVLPMYLIFMAFSHEYLAIGGLLLIYLGITFGKNFIINQ